ncbi:hypothetical protein DFJ66_8224 [Saccharothrix variisporea]|uniref:Uncharacterized protein n=1 Tax=Saccharothrix variisporea TaxID=543527 RepID=A0A495XK74_9PSEU|nr:hypothetical protein DFJ66_8224 [Saccharothrix variisporea]
MVRRSPTAISAFARLLALQRVAGNQIARLVVQRDPPLLLPAPSPLRDVARMPLFHDVAPWLERIERRLAEAGRADLGAVVLDVARLEERGRVRGLADWARAHRGRQPAQVVDAVLELVEVRRRAPLARAGFVLDFGQDAASRSYSSDISIGRRGSTAMTVEVYHERRAILAAAVLEAGVMHAAVTVGPTRPAAGTLPRTRREATVVVTWPPPAGSGPRVVRPDGRWVVTNPATGQAVNSGDLAVDLQRLLQRQTLDQGLGRPDFLTAVNVVDQRGELVIRLVNGDARSGTPRWRVATQPPLAGPLPPARPPRGGGSGSPPPAPTGPTRPPTPAPTGGAESGSAEPPRRTTAPQTPRRTAAPEPRRPTSIPEPPRRAAVPEPHAGATPRTPSEGGVAPALRVAVTGMAIQLAGSIAASLVEGYVVRTTTSALARAALHVPPRTTGAALLGHLGNGPDHTALDLVRSDLAGYARDLARTQVELTGQVLRFAAALRAEPDVTQRRRAINDLRFDYAGRRSRSAVALANVARALALAPQLRRQQESAEQLARYVDSSAGRTAMFYGSGVDVDRIEQISGNLHGAARAFRQTREDLERLHTLLQEVNRSDAAMESRLEQAAVDGRL